MEKSAGSYPSCSIHPGTENRFGAEWKEGGPTLGTRGSRSESKSGASGSKHWIDMNQPSDDRRIAPYSVRFPGGEDGESHCQRSL